MKNLPGTAIENVFSDPKKTLYSIFASGGLFLSQVCFVTGIELHTVQNWVKRGFVAPPIEKKIFRKAGMQNSYYKYAT